MFFSSQVHDTVLTTPKILIYSPRFIRMDGIDFCPLDQTSLICSYDFVTYDSDFFTLFLQHLVVNVAFGSEDDEETKACKTLFQNKTFILGREVA